MSHRPYNVLFLCTGNSARSILAEAALNHMPGSRGKFVGFSAGSQPKGAPNPYAIELLERSGIPTDGLRSKSWDEFARADAPALDFIFTVCDPAAVTGTPEQIRKAFSETLATLRRRIAIFASLPFATLDQMATQQRLRDIGQA